MGTICAYAPAYANIFMDHFERKYIYSFLEGLSLSYLRFTDDIFFIWTCSKDQLITFLNNLNAKHDSVKLEYKMSQSRIPFLDTGVSIKNNYLYTKIYRRRNRQKILHSNSEHPISLENS